MFFTDKEKSIYTPKGSSIAYDPLRLNHLLTIESGNRLNELIALRNAPYDDKGDVSKEGRNRAMIEAAKAELELANIARVAFRLTNNSEDGNKEYTDALALEMLYEFLEWLEGKDETAGTPQSPAWLQQRIASLSPLS